MVKLRLGFLLKHLVPILLVFEENGQRHAFVITAFVLSANDQWFLVTAGHCIKEVNNYIASPGWKLERSCLLDSCHLGVRGFDPVPFLYKDAEPMRVDDKDLGLDYGVLVLSSYYRNLLESNGIRPLDEEAWRSPPDNPDSYWLLGIPGELVEVDFNLDCVRIVPLAYGVERVPERHPGFTETPVPLFYGRIGLDDGMTSIKGVSGGPIFALQQDKQDQVRYWVVALQSRWLNQSHHIAACPAKVLGEALRNVCETRGVAHCQ